MSKVHSRKEIKEAVDAAFKHDSQIVIEPCVSDGIEVTCTVHDITPDELLEVEEDFSFIICSLECSKLQFFSRIILLFFCSMCFGKTRLHTKFQASSLNIRARPPVFVIEI